MNWSATGGVMLAAAVATGAFGAHALRDRLDAYSMEIWEKAVFYHFIHALGLLVAPRLIANPARVCQLLMVGIFFFSGSLYALAISGVRVLGAVTPFGGIAFIAAWLLFAWQTHRSPL